MATKKKAKAPSPIPLVGQDSTQVPPSFEGSKITPDNRSYVAPAYIDQGKATYTTNFFTELINTPSANKGNAANAGATATIYTVPNDKIFYLISACLSCRGATNGVNNRAAILAGVDIILHVPTPVTDDVIAITQSWAIPLKYVGGTVFNLGMDGLSGQSYGSIQGYIVNAVVNQ